MISAHLNAKINGQDNLIYCSTFQLVWNELKEKWAKEDVRLDKDLNIAKELNKSEFTKKNISDDCYMVKSGSVRSGVISEIVKGLKNRFNENTKCDFSGLDLNSILLYAFLLKSLTFKDKFTSNMDLVFSGTRNVEAFGFDKSQLPNKMRNQVKILHYLSDDDFSIQLIPEQKDIIILAVVPPKDTLAETLKYVEFVKYPLPLGSGDKLKIPKLDLDLEHHFDELSGLWFANPSLNGFFISDALQFIKFQLNEEGVKLRSEAALTMRECIIADHNKKLYFNKPFLVCLKQTESDAPYFVMWVQNTNNMKQITR